MTFGLLQIINGQHVLSQIVLRFPYALHFHLHPDGTRVLFSVHANTEVQAPAVISFSILIEISGHYSLHIYLLIAFAIQCDKLTLRSLPPGGLLLTTIFT